MIAMISSSWLFLKHDFLLSPHSYPLFSPAPNSPKHLNPKGHPPPGYVELGVAQESGLRGGHGRPGGQHAKALRANGFVLTKVPLYLYLCLYFWPILISTFMSVSESLSISTSLLFCLYLYIESIYLFICLYRWLNASILGVS